MIAYRRCRLQSHSWRRSRHSQSAPMHGYPGSVFSTTDAHIQVCKLLTSAVSGTLKLAVGMLAPLAASFTPCAFVVAGTPLGA
jgi:hypothetical protein